ncbi:MAG: hypothetical protein L6Q99_10220 [Planctomycetes bacterium]|nr:hypothetical protein [Planctomycetota bacterium]
MSTGSLPRLRAFRSCCAAVGLVAVAHADIHFVDFSSVQGLQLLGDASQVGDVLRVVPGIYDQTGAAWFLAQQPLAGGFDTRFRFRLSGTNPAADGFAFVLQNDAPTAMGSYGGFLGYSAGFGQGGVPCGGSDGVAFGVAIEFDTWFNSEFVDPHGTHVSIHTRGEQTNCAHEQFSLGSTASVPEFLDGAIHEARIVYSPGTLSVFVDDLGAPVLSIALDLAAHPWLANGWVGFTAGTYSAARDTDILDWSFVTGGGASGPTFYCTAKANSQGCVPVLATAGLPSASAANEFHLRLGSVLDDRFGMVLYGTSGRAAVPFEGGWLCEALPTKLALLSSSGGPPPLDCTGAFDVEFNALAASGVDPTLVPGATVDAQFWSRDRFDAFGTNLSSAVEFVLGP